MKTFLKIIILVVAMSFVFKSCGSFSGKNTLVGQKAPDFTLETLNEQEMSMFQFRGSQPAMIFFWATWCPHCRTQLKNLMQQRDQIEKEGIKIILVDSGESLQVVKNYFDANNISFDVFLDLSKKVSTHYRIVGIPTFFFVNEEGIIVAVEHFLPQNFKKILLGLAS